MTDFRHEPYIDGSNVSVCLTLADNLWSKTFFLGGTAIFFATPLAILVILYSVIALNLMHQPCITQLSQPDNSSSAQRYRKQVIMMLGTVVIFFFICLLPFRALTVWIVVAPHEELEALGNEGYYNLLYFCRTMFCLNSAINPILYNLMSSKFRNGFLRLCGLKRSCLHRRTRTLLRNNTSNTSTSTAITNSSIYRTSIDDSISSNRKNSMQHRRCSRSFILTNHYLHKASLETFLSRDVKALRECELKCHFKLIEIKQKDMKRAKSYNDCLPPSTNKDPGIIHSCSLDSVLKGRPATVQRPLLRPPARQKKNSVKFASRDEWVPCRSRAVFRAAAAGPMGRERKGSGVGNSFSYHIIPTSAFKKQEFLDLKESFV